MQLGSPSSRPFGCAQGRLCAAQSLRDLCGSGGSKDVKKSNMEQIVILKLPERRASASERDARRTLKDLQWQRLWQEQRISRSFAVLRRISLATLAQRLRQAQDDKLPSWVFFTTSQDDRRRSTGALYRDLIAPHSQPPPPLRSARAPASARCDRSSSRRSGAARSRR